MIKKLLSVLVLPLLLLLPQGAIAENIKLLHGPYMQNISDTEATIVWEATRESVGWVELAPKDGTNFYSYERPKYFDCTNGVKNTSYLHAVKLTGLKPGTTYRYRVFAQEVLSHKGIFVNYDNNIASTRVFGKAPLEFTTLDKNKKETSFVVFNDVHANKDYIEALMKQDDNFKKELIFFNGDMISILNKSQDFFDGFMDESIRLFAQSKSPYYVRGNHETRGEFSTHFQDYFNPRVPHLYYIVRQGPICFINLDTGEDKPDNDIEYAGIVDYDGYRSEQAEWLKTVKDMPDFKTAKYRIVICHMPTREVKDDWHGMIDCVEKFTPVINTMDIDLMLCGHTHTDSYHEPGQRIQYPVLVNSNKGIIEAWTDGDNLNVQVRRLDGKIPFKRTYHAKQR